MPLPHDSALVAVLGPVFAFIPFGGLIVWVVEFCLYFALLGVFFDLDESDTWYCVCIIFMVSLAGYFLLPWIL